MSAPIEPPFDGQALWSRFFASHGEPRGDEGVLHLSDLAGCDYATYLRMRGDEQLPPDADTVGAWFLGHAVEGYLTEMLAPLVADGWSVRRWSADDDATVEWNGMVGHPDFVLEKGNARVYLDPTTTKARTTEMRDSHAIKTAANALALEAQWGAEIVVRLAFGKVVEAQWHWVDPEDYRERIEARTAALHAIEAGEVPAMAPPDGEEWRCKKYCDAATCPLNGRVEREIVIDEWVTLEA